MAAYSKIRLKTATTPGAPPDAADLDPKEIAFDGVDALYVKRPSDGAVVKVGGAAPKGGAAGQVLTKKSAADGDVGWENPPEALPAGGTNGQVLTKTSSGAAWQSASYAPLVNVNLGTAPNNGTVTLDRTQGEIFTVYANTNFTIALSGAPGGGDSIYIMRCANFGSATLINWPTNIVWVGGTQPNWSPSGWDEVHFRRSADGSRVLAYGLVGV